MKDRRIRGVADLKLKNRCSVLHAIVDHPMISRAEIAEMTGLSKMSMSNIIGELMQMGWVCESDHIRAEAAGLGRRPGYLDLSDESPCVMGVRISRHGIDVSIGDLRTRILRTQKRAYPSNIDEQILINMIISTIAEIQRGFNRNILGIGIAAIGPVSTERGTILSPANFFGLHDIPIVHALAEATGYPVFLSSDNMAAAQAEKLFGEGRQHSNFFFLLTHSGIGCGVIVNDKIYVGECGLAGELGHNSICFNGPICSCGSRGCLELYANVEHMAARIQTCMAERQPSMLAGRIINWENIWHAASRGDRVAGIVAEEYCDYLACALANLVNVFDPEIIFMENLEGRETVEYLNSMLEKCVQSRILAPDCRRMSIRSATFGEQAIAVGSLALVAVRVFDGRLPFYNEEG